MKADRSWFEDATEEVSAELRTKQAIATMVDHRGAAARKRIQEEKIRRGRVAPIILEKLYSVQYWSEFLEKSEDSIRSWCKSGELESRWIKGEYRISGRAMIAFQTAEEKKRGKTGP